MGTQKKPGGAKRDRTADLLHAMQALSQLSYGPIPARSRRRFRRVVPARASSPRRHRRRILNRLPFEIKPLHQALIELYGAAAFTTAQPQPGSDVVVVADADNVGNVVVVFLFVLEEHVLVVVAEIDIFLVLDLRQIVACLGLVLGLLERNDFRAYLLGVEFLLF